MVDYLSCLDKALVETLKNNSMTITTAESCTGGMVASSIVNISGASDIFKEGYITYSNEAKERILGVKHETLEKYKAVSAETAAQMAEGAVRHCFFNDKCTVMTYIIIYIWIFAVSGMGEGEGNISGFVP